MKKTRISAIDKWTGLPLKYTEAELNYFPKDKTKYSKTDYYLGNSKIKRAGAKTIWTQELLEEFKRCRDDFEYWCRKYYKIITLDDGLVNIEPYSFQLDAWDILQKERFTVFLQCRQSSKTTTAAAFLLHTALFNSAYTIAILANKAALAREILSRISLAMSMLPFWMQSGCKAFNKGSIELDTETKIFAAATSSSSIRGFSVNCTTKNTKINIRSKITGEVKSINMDEFASFINR